MFGRRKKDLAPSLPLEELIPVISVAVEPAPTPEHLHHLRNQELFRSHDVHHPMDHTVAGQEWHIWPAPTCPCNNGARLNADPVGQLDQIGWEEPGFESIQPSL